MSIAAYRYAWSVAPGLTGAQFGALFALADHHNGRTGECWPSIARIAAMTGRNPRTIRRALDRLEQAGIIAGDHRHGRVTRWRLPIEPYIESCPQPRAPTPSVSAEDLGSPRPTPEGPHALGGRVPTPYESVLEPVLEPGPRTDAAQMRALAEAARIEAKALEDARRAESKVLDELDPPRRARPAGA